MNPYESYESSIYTYIHLWTRHQVSLLFSIQQGNNKSQVDSLHISCDITILGFASRTFRQTSTWEWLKLSRDLLYHELVQGFVKDSSTCMLDIPQWMQCKNSVYGWHPMSHTSEVSAFRSSSRRFSRPIIDACNFSVLWCFG